MDETEAELSLQIEAELRTPIVKREAELGPQIVKREADPIPPIGSCGC